EQRLARTGFQLRSRNVLQRHHLRSDDPERQPHVREPPLHESFVIIHHRLQQPEESIVLLRRALEIHHTDTTPSQQFLKRPPDALAGVEQLVEAGRLLAASPPQRRRANHVIVDRRHRLQNDDLLAQQIDDQPAPMQEIGAELRLVFADQPDGAIDLVVDVMQPELGRLMHHLEQTLLRMREQLDRLRELEQFGNADVALVVGIAAAFENGTGVYGHLLLSQQETRLFFPAVCCVLSAIAGTLYLATGKRASPSAELICCLSTGVSRHTSSRMWPSFFFFASRYFLVVCEGAISSGTLSTISRPKPSIATYFAGLFVMRRMRRTPRSRRICEPVP